MTVERRVSWLTVIVVHSLAIVTAPGLMWLRFNTAPPVTSLARTCLIAILALAFANHVLHMTRYGILRPYTDHFGNSMEAE